MWTLAEASPFQRALKHTVAYICLKRTSKYDRPFTKLVSKHQQSNFSYFFLLVIPPELSSSASFWIHATEQKKKQLLSKDFFILAYCSGSCVKGGPSPYIDTKGSFWVVTGNYKLLKTNIIEHILLSANRYLIK